MFRGISGGSLLSTHPTLEERRAALQAETYLKRIPVLAAKARPRNPSVPVETNAEDIAYAKR
jgi:heat shock protein HtpX